MEKAPLSYQVDQIVHPTIMEKYNYIVDFMWGNLQTYKFPGGRSRVFSKTSSGVSYIGCNIDDIKITPNLMQDKLLLNGNSLENYIVSIYNLTKI